MAPAADIIILFGMSLAVNFLTDFLGYWLIYVQILFVVSACHVTPGMIDQDWLQFLGILEIAKQILCEHPNTRTSVVVDVFGVACQ